MDVSLVNATLENMELLAGISIPQQQNQYVNFELSAVGYEIAGNPWAFIILADGCVAGYLCCDELQGGELQRRGIGSAALELLRAAAREAGCREIFLSVAADNSPAQDFYTRRGFSLDESGCAEQGCWLCRDILFD